MKKLVFAKISVITSLMFTSLNSYNMKFCTDLAAITLTTAGAGYIIYENTDLEKLNKNHVAGLLLYTAMIGTIGYLIKDIKNIASPTMEPIIKVVEIENKSDHDIRIFSPSPFNALLSKFKLMHALYHSFIVPAHQSFTISNIHHDQNPLAHYSLYERETIYRSLSLYSSNEHSSLIIETDLGSFHFQLDLESKAIYLISSKQKGEQTKILLGDDLDFDYSHHIKIVINEEGMLALKLK